MTKLYSIKTLSKNIYLRTLSAMGWMWHKVNFSEKQYWFEFRVFILLHKLLYQG